jgi:hypothetical protein
MPRNRDLRICLCVCVRTRTRARAWACGGRVLIAYAGPESPAAALRDKELPFFSVHRET